MDKNLPANAGDVGLIPRSGRFPGEGNGSPLQCCCLGNLMGRGVWQAAIHRASRVGHKLVTGSHCHPDTSRQTHILTCVQHHPEPHSWDQGMSSLGHSGTFGSDFMLQMVSGVLIYFMLYENKVLSLQLATSFLLLD